MPSNDPNQSQGQQQSAIDSILRGEGAPPGHTEQGEGADDNPFALPGSDSRQDPQATPQEPAAQPSQEPQAAPQQPAQELGAQPESESASQQAPSTQQTEPQLGQQTTGPSQTPQQADTEAQQRRQEELARQRQAQEQQFQQALSQHYTSLATNSAEIQELFGSGPESAGKIGNLLTQLHMGIRQQTLQEVQQIIPQIAQQVATRTQDERTREEKFFDRWPRLREAAKQNPGVVDSIRAAAAGINAQAPNMSEEQRLHAIGASASITLGLPVEPAGQQQQAAAPAQQQAAPQQQVPNQQVQSQPFQPTRAAGGGQAPGPRQEQLTEQQKDMVDIINSVEGYFG